MTIHARDGNMPIETLQEILSWCSLINIGLLLMFTNFESPHRSSKIPCV
jgi:hypothetical protein